MPCTSSNMGFRGYPLPPGGRESCKLPLALAWMDLVLNLDTEDGLTNGASGIIKHATPTIVWILFDKYRKKIHGRKIGFLRVFTGIQLTNPSNRPKGGTYCQHCCLVRLLSCEIPRDNFDNFSTERRLNSKFTLFNWMKQCSETSS